MAVWDISRRWWAAHERVLQQLRDCDQLGWRGSGTHIQDGCGPNLGGPLVPGSRFGRGPTGGHATCRTRRVEGDAPTYAMMRIGWGGGTRSASHSVRTRL